jgi:peptide deformylase
MEVLKYPNPHLFKVCKPVLLFTPELSVMLESMWETMIAERGIGLASNQVGLEYRMFTMKGPEDEKIFLVNPIILDSSKHPCPLAEGCLSAPDQMVKLYRPSWVKVMYFDEKGCAHTRTFLDIFSVCVQHEIDHLDGISYLQSKAIPKKLRISLAKKWGLSVK